MSSLSLFRLGLPAYVLSAVFVVPPGGASAQRPPGTGSPSLSAAIEEAKRSPFHVVNGVRHMAADGAATGTGPAPPFSWSGGLHVAAREVGKDTQAAGGRGSNRALFLGTVLGIAAGDLVGYLIFNDSLGLIGLSSIPATALALGLAGANPVAAVAASSLGLATGVGAGFLVGKALEEPLYLAAVIPAALAYYGVRLGVTYATGKWGRG